MEYRQISRQWFVLWLAKIIFRDDKVSKRKPFLDRFFQTFQSQKVLNVSENEDKGCKLFDHLPSIYLVHLSRLTPPFKCLQCSRWAFLKIHAFAFHEKVIDCQNSKEKEIIDWLKITTDVLSYLLTQLSIPCPKTGYIGKTNSFAENLHVW